MPTIKLGVLTDMSGTYSANTGKGSLACTEQAVAEFNAGATEPRMPNGFYPNMIQAGCYSAVPHYLKSVANLGAATRRQAALQQSRP